MFPFAVTTSTDTSAVDATARTIGTMATETSYLFVSSTNCWIRQGEAKLITATTFANMTDGDFVTITSNGTTKVYEFDKTGNGVTSGRVLVNIVGLVSAIQVATALATAITANQTDLVVTDNADGTVKVFAPSRSLTITEDVANAAFTVAAAVPNVSAADGSMFVPANYTVYLDGSLGPNVGVIQASVAGTASLTRIKVGW